MSHFSILKAQFWTLVPFHNVFWFIFIYYISLEFEFLCQKYCSSQVQKNGLFRQLFSIVAKSRRARPHLSFKKWDETLVGANFGARKKWGQTRRNAFAASKAAGGENALRNSIGLLFFKILFCAVDPFVCLPKKHSVEKLSKSLIFASEASLLFHTARGRKSAFSPKITKNLMFEKC